MPMRGDAIRSARGSASLIQGRYSSLEIFSPDSVPVHHLHGRWLQTTAKQKIGVELGCIFASSSINILANIQAFVHTPCWCLRLIAIDTKNAPASTFFIVTIDLTLVTPYMRDCCTYNNLELKVLNGIRWELLSPETPFTGSSGGNYIGLTFGYMLNPCHINVHKILIRFGIFIVFEKQRLFCCLQWNVGGFLLLSRQKLNGLGGIS